MKVIVTRKEYKNKATISDVVVYDKNNIVLFACVGLELPWRLNSRNTSCIPKGFYKVNRHISPKFKECFIIENVPERSQILIHAGNSVNDTRGCLLVGRVSVYDAKTDNYLVLLSKNTLLTLLDMLDSTFSIEFR